MSDYKPGDMVSMSSSQITRATVDVVPEVGGTTYSITLPINGSPVAFEVEAEFPATVEQAALLLAAHLANEQTVYDVAIDEDAGEVIVVTGPRGSTFDVTATSLLLEVSQAAVASLSEDGSLVRDLVVIASENALSTGTREYWTKVDGQIEYRNRIMVREIDTGHVFEIDTSQILEVVSRAAGT